MSIEFINIVTVASIIITIWFLATTIIANRKEKRNQTTSMPKSAKSQTDYDKILQSTHWLENEREKNQGEHFDDEKVYLNRAKAIRESSSYFKWVKNC